MSVPVSAAGITLERSLLTRSDVAISAGPVVAIALKYAVVPALSIWVGVIPATPDVDEMSVCNVCSRGSVVGEPPEEDAFAGDFSDTAISSGPLTPAPKLSEIRS